MQLGAAAKTGFFCGSFLCSAHAYADAPMVLLDGNGFTLRAHLQAGLNIVSERNLFWNYAESFAPSAGFDPKATWLEGYIKPGLSFTQGLGGLTLYGKVSAVASAGLPPVGGSRSHSVQR